MSTSKIEEQVKEQNLLGVKFCQKGDIEKAADYLAEAYKLSPGAFRFPLLDVEQSLLESSYWEAVYLELLSRSNTWNLVQKEIFKLDPDINLDDYLIIFLFGAIGDVAPQLSLLPALSRKQGKQIILIGSQLPLVRDLVSIFSGEHIKLEVYVPFHHGFAGLDLIPLKPGLPFSSYQRIFNIQQRSELKPHMLDHIKYRFKLDFDQSLYYPKFSEEQEATALKLLQSLDAPVGKTVVIAPYANSIKYSSDFLPFWQDIADVLQRKGFHVFTNIVNSRRGKIEEPLSGTIPLSIPIKEFIPFLNTAGYLVSARSGLTDLAIFSEALKKVVYPTQLSITHCLSIVDSNCEEYSVLDPEIADVEDILSSWDNL